ncbi:MAG: O-antigen ligase family protein [Clostridiales bacterium]|nr:O-antigen ligase family protein [Candidatus Equinaster intestinalis]
MKKFLKRRTDLSNEENIIYIAAVSVFLPFQITILSIVVLGLYVLLNKKTRALAISVTGWFLPPVFTLFSSCVALAYKNYLGFAASLGFFLIVTLERFFRAIMNRELFERTLNLCCVTSLFAVLVTIIEKLIHFSDIWYRCSGDLFDNQALSFYGHANYLGSIMAASILICAYKVVVIKESKKYYYLIAIANATAMLLTESMFAWIEVFIGLSILLLLARRHQLLGILFIVTAFGGFLLYTVPEIFPRTAHIDGTFNSRVEIWDLAITAIKENFLVGKGFFSFKMIRPEHVHTHNILFDFLLNFGILGSIMLFAMLFIICQKLVLCKNFLRKSGVTYLILSLSCAVLIHSITDMTVFWLQTALLYSVVLSGLGAEEQVLYKIFKNKKQTQTIEEGFKNV